jgi:hypothetical protein
MSQRPQSLADWSAYIETLAGAPLFSQVVAANSQEFARDLVADGLTMDDVYQVMLGFVRQLRATGTKVPGAGAAWDLVNMALTDPTARKGPTMSEADADALERAYKPSGVDDFDVFELEAAFD